MFFRNEIHKQRRIPRDQHLWKALESREALLIAILEVVDEQ